MLCYLEARYPIKLAIPIIIRQEAATIMAVIKVIRALSLAVRLELRLY